MITGAHIIIYSKDADADRAFLRDILQLDNVDVGGGWLIFSLPPSEVAVHPATNNDLHELYLMCDDVEAFARDMLAHDITCSPVQDQGWGLLTSLTLPGGGKLGVYQPRHQRPEAAPAKRARTPRGSGTAKRAKPSGKAKPAKRSSPAKKATRKKAKKATGKRRPRS